MTARGSGGLIDQIEKQFRSRLRSSDDTAIFSWLIAIRGIIK